MPQCKCKMCGGLINFNEIDKTATCEFCGTEQPVAYTDNIKKQSLLNRANTLRLNNDFDKALATYENILIDDPNDAEAHWGICLCRYGIEYVDDPKTKKKIPTCHRTVFNSIFDDIDYKETIANTDVVAKRLYQEEAEKIDKIQKTILAISQKEDPYDIFICYKETDFSGNRTIDSVIAQDIYDSLTDKGYKVFFARITLESKIGSQYEPIIFAALQSSKVMLVIGTKEEYFNAPWVKNEWSRFLGFMKEQRGKYLIPCYKDMDAYNMPEEFLSLQSQDLSKIGFIQDLLRGIDKIFGRDKVEAKSIQKETSSSIESGSNISNLLKRVEMLIQEREFEKAASVLDKVYEISVDNDLAYLYQIFIDLEVESDEMAYIHPNKIIKLKAYKEMLRCKSSDRVKRFIDKIQLQSNDDLIDLINKKYSPYNLLKDNRMIVIKDKKYLQKYNISSIFIYIDPYDGKVKTFPRCLEFDLEKLENIKSLSYFKTFSMENGQVIDDYIFIGLTYSGDVILNKKTSIVYENQISKINKNSPIKNIYVIESNKYLLLTDDDKLMLIGTNIDSDFNQEEIDIDMVKAIKNDCIILDDGRVFNYCNTTIKNKYLENVEDICNMFCNKDDGEYDSYYGIIYKNGDVTYINCDNNKSYNKKYDVDISSLLWIDGLIAISKEGTLLFDSKIPFAYQKSLIDKNIFYENMDKQGQEYMFFVNNYSLEIMEAPYEYPMVSNEKLYFTKECVVDLFNADSINKFFTKLSNDLEEINRRKKQKLMLEITHETIDSNNYCFALQINFPNNYINKNAASSPYAKINYSICFADGSKHSGIVYGNMSENSCFFKIEFPLNNRKVLKLDFNEIYLYINDEHCEYVNAESIANKFMIINNVLFYRLFREIKPLINEGEFDLAKAKLNDLITKRPNSSKAYAYRLLVDFKVKSFFDLEYLITPLDKIENYKKAIDLGEFFLIDINEKIKYKSQIIDSLPTTLKTFIINNIEDVNYLSGLTCKFNTGAFSIYPTYICTDKNLILPFNNLRQIKVEKSFLRGYKLTISSLQNGREHYSITVVDSNKSYIETIINHIKVKLALLGNNQCVIEESLLH